MDGTIAKPESSSGADLVEILLETRKHLPNLTRSTEISNRIGYGIVVLESQQRGKLILIQLPHSLGHLLPSKPILGVREYREQERRDKADTAIAQAARRRVRAQLRKGK